MLHFSSHSSTSDDLMDVEGGQPARKKIPDPPIGLSQFRGLGLPEHPPVEAVGRRIEDIPPPRSRDPGDRSTALRVQARNGTRAFLASDSTARRGPPAR